MYIFTNSNLPKMTANTQPNVLLIVIDSLRARNVGTYGYHRDTTPFFDSLAADSLIYDSAWSPAVWTLPSHVSMLTGYEVREHQVQSAADAIDSEAIIFQELAAKRGYETGIFSENTWLTEADMGISRAFQTVVGKPSVLYPDALSPGTFAHENEYGDYLGYLWAALDSSQPVHSVINGVVSKLQYDAPNIGRLLVPEPSGEYFVNQFIEWERERAGPWAACINLMDAHRPYVPDSQYDEWDDGTAREIQESLADPVWDFIEGKEPVWKLRALEALYDGGIRQADAYLEILVDHLKRQGEFDDTLLIVVGDHGEGFGEYSDVRDDIAVEHKQGLHHVQTYIPLLVNPPTDKARRISTPVSLTETARVISEVADGDPVEYQRDRPVITVYDDISTQFISNIRTEDITTGLESVIEVTDGFVVKHTRYRDRPETTISEIILDASSSYVKTDITPDIESAFERLVALRNLCSEASVNEAAVDRLEKLGYV